MESMIFPWFSKWNFRYVAHPIMLDYNEMQWIYLIIDAKWPNQMEFRGKNSYENRRINSTVADKLRIYFVANDHFIRNKNKKPKAKNNCLNDNEHWQQKPSYEHVECEQKLKIRSQLESGRKKNWTCHWCQFDCIVLPKSLHSFRSHDTWRRMCRNEIWWWQTALNKHVYERGRAQNNIHPFLIGNCCFLYLDCGINEVFFAL